MINVYPQRNTTPDLLDREINKEWHDKNLACIEKAICKLKNPTIVVAFGNNLEKRYYLKACLTDIVMRLSKYCPTWKSIGTTVKGHPKHLSRAGYCELTDFDIKKYLGLQK